MTLLTISHFGSKFSAGPPSQPPILDPPAILILFPCSPAVTKRIGPLFNTCHIRRENTTRAEAFCDIQRHVQDFLQLVPSPVLQMSQRVLLFRLFEMFFADTILQQHIRSALLIMVFLEAKLGLPVWPQPGHPAF